MAWKRGSLLWNCPCRLLNAEGDVGSNPGLPPSRWLTLSDGPVPRGLAPPSVSA